MSANGNGNSNSNNADQYKGKPEDIEEGRGIPIVRGERTPLVVKGKTFDVSVEEKDQRVIVYYDPAIEMELQGNQDVKNRLNKALALNGFNPNNETIEYRALIP